MDYTDGKELRSPFYRVATRFVIRDDKQRIVVVQNHNGKYELPGGGWEHSETMADCADREAQEELGVRVTNIGDVFFVYRSCGGEKQYVHLRLAIPVEVSSHDFRSDDSVVASARFVNRQEFLTLDWSPEDQEVLDHIDKLWPPVEKAEQTS